ncbi:MAG: PIN domain-containing protein [Erysipelotrichaceae bacterium]|nr:PIN domain-containing protein [Erysipelotrichaceae bacterium]
MENSLILDTNAILRYLLDDDHDSYIKVTEAVQSDKCYLILPVVQEAVFVLEGYYHVPRQQIRYSFIRMKDAVIIPDEDIYLKVFDYYCEAPKLDFVDCLMCAYHSILGIDIFTFDKNLQKKILKIKE